jgi:energy-coupling factor transporter ATP-binding protein EcfA2
VLHAAVRADGRVVAIDSRTWFVHRRELGAAYRSELARELSRLGFAIQRGTGRAGRYFEIEGIPGGLLDRWSSRHHEVQRAIDARLADKRQHLRGRIAAGSGEAAVTLDALRRRVRLSAAEDRYMSWSTRGSKPASHGDLDRHWRRAGRAFALDARQLERLRAHRTPPAADGRGLLRRLTEFDATFEDREARAIALETLAGSGIRDALGALERLWASGELVRLADRRATTGAHRAREHGTVDLAHALAAERVEPIPTELVKQEERTLERELQQRGGQLVAEQREALKLACSDRQVVVIEGQAGSGKSTILIAVARAHQADGREIVVTSTAALAAQRLANELTDHGVYAHAVSTVGLHAAISTGRLTVGPNTTIVHDEAALASTREQQQLLAEVHASGARLIAIGDPRQSHAVGAGGLWPRLERAAYANDAHVELTRNVRARDPADRRDQARFRHGEHEQALRGYAARGRIHVSQEQRRVEDHALEAAHHDRQNGKRTMIVAQTSNDKLDELNARAQAIRFEHGELGRDGIAIPGRPYRVHAGDEIQIRHTIHHPELGGLSNGTTATITHTNPAQHQLALQLPDGRTAVLDREQIESADLRLAYVQHPFPAQGHTSDTTHLILAEHATQEGNYVALTRAREQTDIHATRPEHDPDDRQDPLVQLAERMSQTEPDTPSINTPLAHEQHLARHPDTTIDAETPLPTSPLRSPGFEPQPEHERSAPARRDQPLGREPPAHEQAQSSGRSLIDGSDGWEI